MQSAHRAIAYFATLCLLLSDLTRIITLIGHKDDLVHLLKVYALIQVKAIEELLQIIYVINKKDHIC